MARLLTAGWETGSVEEMNGAYGTSCVTVTTGHPRTGSYALHVKGGALTLEYHGHAFDSSEDTIFGRIAVRMDTHQYDGSGPFLVFYDENGDTQMDVYWNHGSQAFSIRRGGVTVLATGHVTIQPNRYYIVEWKYLIDNSTGEFTLKVNSVTDIAYTGNTQASAVASVRSFRIYAYDHGSTWDLLDIDDVAINNNAGTVQNAWIGLGGVFLLKPNGEGATVDWTPSTGTVHYTLVDETPANTTDYVQAGSALTELFNVEACPDYVTSIDLVQVIYQSAIITSGSQELVDVVRQGTVDYSGGTVTEVSLTPSYVLHKGSVWYEQPDGSGAWGTAAVNAMQIGLAIP